MHTQSINMIYVVVLFKTCINALITHFTYKVFIVINIKSDEFKKNTADDCYECMYLILLGAYENNYRQSKLV